MDERSHWIPQTNGLGEEYDGAAAGSRYEQTIIYRRQFANACVELLATTQSGEIANYPGGTVQEFVREEINDVRERIVTSFTFLEP